LEREKKIVQIKWNLFFSQEAQKEKEREENLVEEDNFLFVCCSM
jgi:hypothetical protein